MHVPLLTHGKLAQLLILYWQFRPVKAIKQAHAYEFRAFKQLPPFRHGIEAQFYLIFYNKLTSFFLFYINELLTSIGV